MGVGEDEAVDDLGGEQLVVGVEDVFVLGDEGDDLRVERLSRSGEGGEEGVCEARKAAVGSALDLEPDRVGALAA